MTAPTTPAVALPEAVRAALDAYAEAAYRLGYDCGRGAGRVIEDAGRGATAQTWADQCAAILAYGRECAAVAMAEVDAACERVGSAQARGVIAASRNAEHGWQAWNENSHGVMLPYPAPCAPTPTAAILAAAAALDDTDLAHDITREDDRT